MRKAILKVIGSTFGAVCISGVISLVVLAEQSGTLKLGELSDNEVMLHSSNLNAVSLFDKEGEEKKHEDGNADSSMSIDGTVINLDGTDTNIDKLFEFLEKEEKYLEKLDAKYDSLFGNASESSELVDEIPEIPKIQEIPEKDEIEKDAGKPDDSETEGVVDEKLSSEVVEDEPDDKVESGKDGDMKKDYSSPFDAAEIHYEMGKYNDALDAYKSIMSDFPENKDYIWSRFQVGNCYRNMKKLNKAISEYQSFINEFPDSFWAEQAAWYIEDAKWWKQWNSRISIKGEPGDEEALVEE